jgi:hypothetical protein
MNVRFAPTAAIPILKLNPARSLMVRATALVPLLIRTEINAVRNQLHQKATEQVDGPSSYDCESLPCVENAERLAIPTIRALRDPGNDCNASDEGTSASVSDSREMGQISPA